MAEAEEDRLELSLETTVVASQLLPQPLMELLQLTPAMGGYGGGIARRGTEHGCNSGVQFHGWTPFCFMNMKFNLSILALLATILNTLGAVSYYGNFYGNGGGLTNLPGVGTNAIDATTFSLNTTYTNSTGSNLLVFASISFQSSGTGNVYSKAYVDAGGGFVLAAQAGGVPSVGITYANSFSFPVPPSGKYYVTNDNPAGGTTTSMILTRRVYSSANGVGSGGGGGSGSITNLPATTNLLAGNGGGGASDSGVAISSVVTNNQIHVRFGSAPTEYGSIALGGSGVETNVTISAIDGGFLIKGATGEAVVQYDGTTIYNTPPTRFLNGVTGVFNATGGSIPGSIITSPVTYPNVPEFARKPFVIWAVGASQSAGIYTYTNQAWINAGTNFLPNGAVGSPYFPFPAQVLFALTNQFPSTIANIRPSWGSLNINGLLIKAAGGTGIEWQNQQIRTGATNAGYAQGAYFITNDYPNTDGQYMNLYQCPRNGGTNILVILDGVENSCNTNQTTGGYGTIDAQVNYLKTNYLANIATIRAWGTNAYIIAKTTGISADGWASPTLDANSVTNKHFVRRQIANAINDWIRTNLAQKVDWVYDGASENNPGENRASLTVDYVGHGNLVWHQLEGANMVKAMQRPRFQMLPRVDDKFAKNFVVQAGGAILVERWLATTNPVLVSANPETNSPALVLALSNTPSGPKWFGDASAMTGIGNCQFFSAKQTNDQTSAANFTGYTNSTDLQITVPAGDWQGIVYLAFDGNGTGGSNCRITNSPPCQFGGMGLSGYQSGSLLANVNNYHSGWENVNNIPTFIFHSQSQQYGQAQLTFNAHTTQTTTFIIQFGQNNSASGGAILKAGNTMTVWGKAQ